MRARSAGAQHTGSDVEAPLAKSDLLGKLGRRAREISGVMSSTAIEQRKRQVLFDGELLDEHRAFREQAKLIEGREPAAWIGNGRSCAGRTR